MEAISVQRSSVPNGEGALFTTASYTLKLFTYKSAASRKLFRSHRCFPFHNPIHYLTVSSQVKSNRTKNEWSWAKKNLGIAKADQRKDTMLKGQNPCSWLPKTYWDRNTFPYQLAHIQKETELNFNLANCSKSSLFHKPWPPNNQQNCFQLPQSDAWGQRKDTQLHLLVLILQWFNRLSKSRIKSRKLAPIPSFPPSLLI